MDYINENKLAWEEAFDNRINAYGEDCHLRLQSDEYLPFISQSMRKEIESVGLKNKSVAQFCCNNGCEILSLSKLGFAEGIGFDIAENIIGQAREMALKAGVENCDFVLVNILEMSEIYHNKFDLIFLTIGAITWFKDLDLLFDVASKCLKTGGKILINDFHPFENMLALPGEPLFNENILNQFSYSYFKEEPWLEDEGIDYISGKYASKTFQSFSHSLSAIVNSLSKNALKTIEFNEYDYDIGLTDVYDKKGIPLAFTLIAEKH